MLPGVNQLKLRFWRFNWDCLLFWRLSL